MCVCVAAILHSEVSVDIIWEVFSVKEEVVTNNIDSEAGAPV